MYIPWKMNMLYQEFLKNQSQRITRPFVCKNPLSINSNLLIILVGLLRDLDFIVNVFPLHDKEDIKLIERDWFMSKDSLFKSQDIRKKNKSEPC